MPRMARPPEMWSRVVAIFAVKRRLAERVRADHQADPDVLGGLRPGRQRQPALEDRTLGGPDDRVEVVPRPERVVAEAVGALAGLEQARPVGVLVPAQRAKSDVGHARRVDGGGPPDALRGRDRPGPRKPEPPPHTVQAHRHDADAPARDGELRAPCIALPVEQGLHRAEWHIQGGEHGIVRGSRLDRDRTQVFTERHDDGGARLIGAAPHAVDVDGDRDVGPVVDVDPDLVEPGDGAAGHEDGDRRDECQRPNDPHNPRRATTSPSSTSPVGSKPRPR